MKPIINFNGGSPIALCNRCFIIMCYVVGDEEGKEARVITSKLDPDGNLCTSIPKGGLVPVYCDKCKNLLNYSLNE